MFVDVVKAETAMFVVRTILVVKAETAMFVVRTIIVVKCRFLFQQQSLSTNFDRVC